MPKGIKIHSSKNLEACKKKAAKIIKILKKLFPHAKIVTCPLSKINDP